MDTLVADVDHHPGPHGPAELPAEPPRPEVRAGRLDAWPRDVWLDAIWDSEDRDLGPKERQVAYCYARYAGRGDVSWCEWGELKRRTGIRSRDSISTAIKKLVAAGWLVLVEKARQHYSARYRLAVPRRRPAAASSPAIASSPPSSPDSGPQEPAQRSGIRTAEAPSSPDSSSQQSGFQPPAVRIPDRISQRISPRDPLREGGARARNTPPPPVQPQRPPTSPPPAHHETPAPVDAGLLQQQPERPVDRTATHGLMLRAAAAMGLPPGPPPRCPQCSDQAPGSWGPSCADCARLKRAYNAHSTQIARAIARARRACRDCNRYGLLLGPHGRPLTPDMRCQHLAVPPEVWAGATDTPSSGSPARPEPSTAEQSGRHRREADPPPPPAPAQQRPPGWRPSPYPRSRPLAESSTYA